MYVYMYVCKIYVYQELDERDKNHRQNDDPFDILGMEVVEVLSG